MAIKVLSKKCSKCKQIKPLAEFGKDKNNKDGLNYYCKVCHKATTAQYRQSKKGKNYQENYKKSEKFKNTQKRYQKQYRQNHFKERQAQNAVNYAIKHERLPRADTMQCHYGNHSAEEYHHWHGYEPEHLLDVIPVCIKCHRRTHTLKKRIA